MVELVLVLCGVIVKTAFRVWIGNDPFADNLTGDLTDMIRSRVSGALEQRKIRSRFARMEEIVADRLLASLQGEFRNLDEGERNAAIIAVTETFNQARLTGEMLLAKDLDPLYLERYVRKFTGTTTVGLSQDGLALYDRVLAQCCAYIIELADKLPGFQRDAFAELLHRDRQILARIEDVLERLPIQSNQSHRDRIGIAYRQRLATVLDRLELFGLDFASKWYSLSIAYVTLSFSGVENVGADTFQEQLGTWPRLVIQGRAGSGKTTILQWLAVRAARTDFEGAARSLNGYVPFFIRLREYANEDLPTPEEFLNKIAPLLAPQAREWPRQQLEGGRALVLIDGIDELPEKQRPAVNVWLREMIDLFPHSRYIVTTRPGAADDIEFGDLDFTVANLEPMNPVQVRRFIVQWHLAMLEWCTDDQEREHLANLETSLLARVEDDRFLRDLADTPLLAGLVCALNQHLRAQLPGRRGEVFEKALIMFDQRDQARHITSDIQVDLAMSNHLLGDLSLWMVRNGVAEVPSTLAQEIIGRSAASLPNGPHDPLILCRHLLMRSGLLREPTARNIDFVHKSFQEYLAAKALMAADNVREIVLNANQDQWRQVVILSAGQGNTRQTTDLLLGLLGKSSGAGRLRRLLAVACMAEMRSASPEVLAALDRAIPRLLPPRSIEDAEMLSHAGPRIVPLLEKLKLVKSNQKAATIRTAALIGGYEALKLIANIASTWADEEDDFADVYLDPGEFYSELMRAWQYFDPARYVAEVLAGSGIPSITVQDMRLLQHLVNMPAVNYVSIDIPDDIKDTTALDSLPVLRGLSFYNINNTTLTEIMRAWPTLTRFKILGAVNLQDISALEMNPDIRDLELCYCEDLNDYRVLSRLSHLENLWMQGQTEPDLSVLAGLSSLRDLTISEAGTVDLSPLSSNENLEIVVFDDTNVLDLPESFLPTLRINTSSRRATDS